MSYNLIRPLSSFWFLGTDRLPEYNHREIVAVFAERAWTCHLTLLQVIYLITATTRVLIQSFLLSQTHLPILPPSPQDPLPSLELTECCNEELPLLSQLVTPDVLPKSELIFHRCHVWGTWVCLASRTSSCSPRGLGQPWAAHRASKILPLEGVAEDVVFRTSCHDTEGPAWWPGGSFREREASKSPETMPGPVRLRCKGIQEMTDSLPLKGGSLALQSLLQ